MYQHLPSVHSATQSRTGTELAQCGYRVSTGRAQDLGCCAAFNGLLRESQNITQINKNGWFMSYFSCKEKSNKASVPPPPGPYFRLYWLRLFLFWLWLYSQETLTFVFLSLNLIRLIRNICITSKSKSPAQYTSLISQSYVLLSVNTSEWPESKNLCAAFLTSPSKYFN